MPHSKSCLNALTPFLLPAITIASASAQVKNADTKAYAGSSCMPVNQANLAFHNIQGGSIVNSSDTGTLSVSCPIVKDNTRSGATGAKGIASVIVTVIDGNPNPNAVVSCVIQSRDKTDHVQDSRADSTVNLPGIGTVFMQLVGGFGNQNVPLSPSDGSYTLSCSLPPAAIVNEKKMFSSIVGYTISEDVGGDPTQDEEP